MEVNNKTISNMSNNIEAISVASKNINKIYNAQQKILSVNSLDKNLEDSKVNKENNYNESLDKLVSQVNEKFKVTKKELSYEVHEKTNRFIVKVKDSESGKIIKEIPTEESLDLFAKMLEMAGLLVDEKS